MPALSNFSLFSFFIFMFSCVFFFFFLVSTPYFEMKSWDEENFSSTSAGEKNLSFF